MSLTVTESAIIDLQRQKEAIMARAKNFDPAAAGENARLIKELGFDPAAIEELTENVQLKLTFKDPMATRAQLELLAGAIEEAKALSYDHSLGIMKQRLRMRRVMKEASDGLTIMQGKMPSGRHRKGASKASDKSY